MKPLHQDHEAQDRLLFEAINTGLIEREERIRKMADQAIEELQRNPNGGRWSLLHFDRSPPAPPIHWKSPTMSTVYTRLEINLTPSAAKPEEARFLIENMIREQLEENLP